MREKLLLSYLFFFKALEYNYKTLLGFSSCSPPAAGWAVPCVPGAAAVPWLGGRMGTVFIRGFQVERCAYPDCVAPLNTEDPGLQSSSTRKIPVPGSCRPEPRVLTESCVQHKQNPL